jgi:hypothetical protein
VGRAQQAPQIPPLCGRWLGTDETKSGAPVSELPEDIQRRTAKRPAALVLTILRGETTAVEAARKHDLTVADVESRRDTFVLAAENALRSQPRDEEALKDEQIKKLERKVGQLVPAVRTTGRTWQP